MKLIEEFFDGLQDTIIMILEESQKTSLLDYLPHLLSGLTLIASMLVVIIQYRQNVVLHKRTQLYNTKKETILEALAFIDTFISWLEIDDGIAPIREETTDVALTVEARTIHNKLCISCENDRIVKLFIDILVPSPKQEKGDPIFAKYNEFRNECRKELGYKSVDLPDDRIYLSQVTTKALQNKSKNR